LDSATITTGLLHDTIEDTKETYESVKKEFGEEVANLVDGVTKISALEDKASSASKAENFRKLILATSKDIRVLLVKLADRLHNMRTIHFVKDKNKIIRKAKETMEIYAPLADRMGMNRIRDELEDLSFSVLNKPARDLILQRLKFIKNNRDDTFKSISLQLIDLLEKNGIKATITGREKTPFSIWRKVQNKKISLEQLTDIIGFRIIVKNIEDCYKTLGVFHNKFRAIPGKFKDYISTPKINKYKSIHTSVIGPTQNRIEIQIRTFEMQEFAERGIASHWKYKSSEKFSDLSWKEYDWLRDLVEIIETGNSPEHYYEFTKLQMFQENVFCFTPKGAVIKLPMKATPIDFAYAVHTKIGDSAIGCSINGRETTLQTILKNGDLIKIETSKNASPSLHWLSSSKTGKARASIRRYWQDKSLENTKITEKNYTTSIEVDLPHKPGALGDISALIGLNKANIINVELLERKEDYLKFSFDLQIKDLKNFTNLISQIKQSNLNFKIIRHKEKKNAFIRRIFKNFKRN
jgi:guanosine-3',5'-bis(diphosphate) 3'-pyrophosphohydrolase